MFLLSFSLVPILTIVIRAFHNVSQLQSSGAGGDPSIAVFACDSSKGLVHSYPRGHQGCRAWWDVRTQLQGMGLESHIGSMGFRWGVYKALGSPITIASFCDVILPRFLSIGIKPFLRKFVLVFFYDILIYSPTRELHPTHLHQNFEVLRAHKLYVNRNKCCFEQPQLEYLRHIISGEGVAANPNKIKDMLDWPAPTNLRSLKGFLGLTGYYRRFVENYGKVAWPLTQLLKEDSFKWSHEAQFGFRMMHQGRELGLCLCKKGGPLLIWANCCLKRLKINWSMRGN